MRRHLLDPAAVPGLIRACAKLCFRPPPEGRPHAFAIKLRSQSLVQADWFHVAFPGAAFVFLYRDGVSWARSFWRFLQHLGVPLVLEGEALRSHWWILTGAAAFALLQPDPDPDGSVRIERTLAPAWAIALETYLRHLDAGVPFLQLRYNELAADREAMAARLLRHAGLPVSASAAAIRAFAQDSQAGTPIARDRRDAQPFPMPPPFTADSMRWPRITTSDMILPGIYS